MAKSGFQLMHGDGRFSQIWPHIKIIKAIFKNNNIIESAKSIINRLNSAYMCTCDFVGLIQEKPTNYAGIIDSGLVQSQVDAIYLVQSTDAILSIPHLHSVKSCPEKSRLITYVWGQDAQCNDIY